MIKPQYESLDWPVPPNVRAYFTRRHGGESQSPYDSLNLSQAVEDSQSAVLNNRLRIAQALSLPGAPVWLQQIHSPRVIDAACYSTLTADAAVVFQPGVVCTVLTADCLPLLLCATDGTCVGASHCGWRGIVAGIVENTVQRLGQPPEKLLAYLGPSIGPYAYEVGEDMRRTVLSRIPDAARAFRPIAAHRWHANLYTMVRLQLQSLGVHAIYGDERCTFSEVEHFFSYRRDGKTGRMASFIWLE